MVRIRPGMVCGRRTVLREGPYTRTKRKQRRWWCRCACGREMLVLQDTLVYGKGQSCGCLQRETICNLNRQRATHGESNPITVEFRAWSAMLRRCYSPKDKDFPNYGGRGIVVCDRWRNSYADFLHDVGRRPAGCSLGRKDNDGPYAPDNVRWETLLEQNRNKRTVRHLQIGSARLDVKECAKRFGVNYQTIMSRLWRGWSLEAAVSTPLRRPDYRWSKHG